MLFNSFQFLLFFPIVTLLYFLLPYKFRWFHLLVASCIFYMAFVPVYILILGFTIVIDYIAGIMIENATGRRRKWFLIMSLVANIGVLAVFKYYNFFIDNINYLFSSSGNSFQLPLLAILLPIGLSFHTFQAMSYTIEVYRGHQKAERHFGIYALYVMFYPQLVAGPIERPQNLLHQFHEHHNFDYEECKEGLKQMLWGFFKKIVIADRLALVVKTVFTHPHDFSGPSLAIATLFFTFQIYCDFSGYSDIAIGAARVMGFKLMRNFNRPYFSKSISEFWTRWHISLSTWFKDYLYIPLGGNRVPVPRMYLNLAIVFLVSGLWHGANWTFIAWGALHAFYLIFGMVTKKARVAAMNSIGIKEHSVLNKTLSIAITFLLASFAWIYFVSANIHDALYVSTHLFSGWGQVLSLSGIKSVITAVGGSDTIMGTFNVGMGVILILFLEYVQYKTDDGPAINIVQHRPTFARFAFYSLLILTILLIGVYDNQEFIYFQF
ncbi:MAG: rane bound O-acyl transferase family protein [Flavipsychrobacter sp.]|nr:rane bound O-acyl transferase family protein [Flavipsychrobacter sp.]